MAEQTVTRRSFLNYAVTAVVVGIVAGVGGYYGGLLSVPPTTITSTAAPSTITSTKTVERTTTVGPGQVITTTVSQPPVTTTITRPPVTSTVTTTTTATPEPTESEKLIEAAKNEGGVMFYASLFPEWIITLVDAFKAQYPFINVEYYRAGSAAVLEKYYSEVRAGVVRGDVIETSFAGQYPKLREDDLLLRYDSPMYDQLVKAAPRDPGYWTSCWCSYIMLTYNTALVKETPTSWRVLVDPEYRGKVAIYDARAGGGPCLSYYLLRERVGLDFVRELAAIKPTLSKSTSQMVEWVASGENVFGHGVTPVVRDGVLVNQMPIKVAMTKEGFSGSWAGMAIAKDAPHPNAAKLWFDFILSYGGQTTLTKAGYNPIRADVPGPSDMDKIGFIESDLEKNPELLFSPVVSEYVSKEPSIIEEFTGLFA